MNFWWPQMRADVFQHVRKCYIFQRGKPAPNTRVRLHAAEPSAKPLEKLSIYFVGPLTRTKRGNSAILVLDSFSKFVSLFPVRRMASSVVIDCLEKGYFPAYGTPTNIFTDNARVFRLTEDKDLCFRWGVAHIYTTPYYPQASLAERVNRILKSALKILHHNTRNMWDEDLPHLTFAFNAALHGSTQSTPDLLFLGRKIRPPMILVGMCLHWRCEVRRKPSTLYTCL